MTFLHPLLLAGAAMVAVPIVLHLLMRRKPRRLEFPALQLVRQRHDTNRRRLRLRHRGHDVILFHVLDEAEVAFPFEGMVELEEPETAQRLALDAAAFRHDYLAEVQRFRETYRRECYQSGVDYVPLDTSMRFDRALAEYLMRRSERG